MSEIKIGVRPSMANEDALRLLKVLSWYLTDHPRIYISVNRRMDRDMEVAELSFVDRNKEAKTVDAVPVVRCGECARRKNCRTTNTWAIAPSDDWYCADGKKMDG